MSRDEIVRSSIDVTGRGLEFGPLDRPIMPKREGFRVEIVDYLSTAELRAHYGGSEERGVDAAAIEEVDHVTGGRSILEVIDEAGAYEWIVASHVIEHIPDPLTFLADAATLLSPTGRLVLVIPDKRYCFDVFGELTSAGQWVDAHRERRTGPTPGQVVDYLARVASVDGGIAWGQIPGVEPIPLYGPSEMRDGHRRASDGDTFGGEIHCWRFIPASFRLLMADLQALGQVRLGVVEMHDTVGVEFFVTLGRDAPAVGPDERLALLEETAGLSPRSTRYGEQPRVSWRHRWITHRRAQRQ